MKITFPHLGNLYISAKVLFEELGVDYVIPPFNNNRAIEIGTKYSPEFACMPLKYNIGNYAQAYALGADTILMLGGDGPCRFGYYSEIQREIMADIGKPIDVIAMEMPDGGIFELVKRIKKLNGGLNFFKFFRALKNMIEISILVDDLEKLTFKIRPREIRKGSLDTIYKNFQKDVVHISGYKDALALIAGYKGKLSKVEINKDITPLKIGIVGEVYTIIDPYINFNIDAKLGRMGVEVHRSIMISDLAINMRNRILRLPEEEEYKAAAEKYLAIRIGGHAHETIGNAALYAKSGFDGIIHIYPFSCMPEIVAKSILPAVEKDFDLPQLTLTIDEMTGEAGYQTRLEAFIDLIERKREEKTLEKTCLRYGN